LKALTLWQPWAQLVAIGEKRVETRCWTTKYRGELAIHAAARTPPRWLGKSQYTQTFRDEIADVFKARRDRDDRAGFHVDDALAALPHGSVLCVVRLVEIRETSVARLELEAIGNRRELIFGNYEDGRYAWYFEPAKLYTKPIPAKGRQMLWEWNE
jgi:activating signal cointegrator 1